MCPEHSSWLSLLIGSTTILLLRQSQAGDGAGTFAMEWHARISEPAAKILLSVYLPKPLKALGLNPNDIEEHRQNTPPGLAVNESFQKEMNTLYKDSRSPSHN